jgi:ATP-binding cassette subfamily B (MDR/TAP) protein 1
MTLVMLAFMPVLVITGYFISVITAKITMKSNRAYAFASSLAQQALGNVRTVFAFNGQSRTVDDYNNALEMPERVGIRQGFYSGLTIGTTNCVAYCGYALAMWYGAQRVADAAYTGGDVVNVLLAALIGGFALGQAVPNWEGFQTGRAAAARLFFIMNRQPLIDMNAGGDKPKEVSGAIEFQGVSFAYPSRPDKMVFRDFSLRVPAGQTVALVGESGSGKSTAVSLIERFYDPAEGSVLLDGQDIRGLDLGWLRSHLGLVSQEPTLFATTIRENILFGKPGATEEEMVAAARSANAHSFISSLPNGYDTHVGEKGVQMSGGQKQRIAIARAILKNPAVLLLDEATSALDAESERVVQEALDRLMVGRTTVVVAHRLSTVRDADAIAVVKQGSVIELGTHSELLAKGGAYATLVQMQGAQEEDEDRNRRKVVEMDKARGGQSLLQQVFKNPNWAVPGKMGGEGVVELAEEVVEVADEVADVVARTASNVVHAVETGQFTNDTSKTSTVRRRKRKWSLKKADESEEDGAEVEKGRIAALNRPEMPAAICGILGSIGMGMLTPSFSIIFSSMVGVFYVYYDGAKLHSTIVTWLQIKIYNILVKTCRCQQNQERGTKMVTRFHGHWFWSIFLRDIAVL